MKLIGDVSLKGQFGTVNVRRTDSGAVYLTVSVDESMAAIELSLPEFKKVVAAAQFIMMEDSHD